MYWRRTASRVFQGLTGLSFLLLLLMAAFSVVWPSLWLADSPPSLMGAFWGSSVTLALCISVAAGALSLLALVLSAVAARSLAFRPPLPLSYALIAWASASTFVFLEALPWRWGGRAAAVEQALLADPAGALTRLFVAKTQCAVHAEEHCWRQIAPFVDRQFCRYAAPYAALYPLHIALSFVVLTA
jgi:hypothetical protein